MVVSRGSILTRCQLEISDISCSRPQRVSGIPPALLGTYTDNECAR